MMSWCNARKLIELLFWQWLLKSDSVQKQKTKGNICNLVTNLSWSNLCIWENRFRYSKASRKPSALNHFKQCFAHKQDLSICCRKDCWVCSGRTASTPRRRLFRPAAPWRCSELLSLSSDITPWFVGVFFVSNWLRLDEADFAATPMTGWDSGSESERAVTGGIITDFTWRSKT